MKRFDVSEWASFKGSFTLEFDVPRVRLGIVSQGCTVYVVVDDRTVPVFCGIGFAEVDLIVGQPFVLAIEQDDDASAAVRNVADRPVTYASSQTHTDLSSPDRAGKVSPEVQAVIDKMNRNAIVREQAMLRALGRRA